MHRIKSLLLTLALAACGGGMPDGGLVDTTPMRDAGPPMVDAGMPKPMTCGPSNLCSRTINECATPNLTQASCEGWYARASNCRDMAAYTACNCECVKEATCSDYFACGNLCFNDHCK